MTDSVTVTRAISASAETVWRLLADVTRMPEWSPESTKVRWVGGATHTAVGARFKGTNSNGPRTWKSDGQITEYQPGVRLAFRITAGPFKIADWTYSLSPTVDGCVVTESWTERRSRVMKVVSRRASGVADRPDHNRQSMERTLANLASTAEGSSTPIG